MKYLLISAKWIFNSPKKHFVICLKNVTFELTGERVMHKLCDVWKQKKKITRRLIKYFVLIAGDFVLSRERIY